MNTWYVYIVRCSDSTFYTGITNCLEKRIAVHNSGKGAKYTRGRTPVKLVFVDEMFDRSSALRRELEIKSLSRSRKEYLVRYWLRSVGQNR